MHESSQLWRNFTVVLTLHLLALGGLAYLWIGSNLDRRQGANRSTKKSPQERPLHRINLESVNWVNPDVFSSTQAPWPESPAQVLAATSRDSTPNPSRVDSRDLYPHLPKLDPIASQEDPPSPIALPVSFSPKKEEPVSRDSSKKAKEKLPTRVEPKPNPVPPKTEEKEKEAKKEKKAIPDTKAKAKPGLPPKPGPSASPEEKPQPKAKSKHEPRSKPAPESPPKLKKTKSKRRLKQEPLKQSKTTRKKALPKTKPPNPTPIEKLSKTQGGSISGSGRSISTSQRSKIPTKSIQPSSNRRPPDFQWYHQVIHDSFHQRWKQPRNLSGRLVFSKVKIMIGRDGGILGATIIRSSGNQSMDQSVWNTVRSTKKIAPLPDGLGDDSYEVIINFELD